MVSLPSKGTALKIKDNNQLEKDIAELKQAKDQSNNKERNKQKNAIIKYLLDKHLPVTKYDLMSHFFISETTLYNRIIEIKAILKKYNLLLKYTTNIGYEITGKEIDKRTCLVKTGLDYETISNDPENKTFIYNVVADTFIKYQYHVNEETLQNITAHIFRSLQRIQRHHYIEESSDENVLLTTEFKIADEILTKLINKDSIKPQYYTNEVGLLTQIILGKLNYTGDDTLKENINYFIDRSFESIDQKFSINFNSVENLRLLLVLHLMPLFYRIKSGTQLINPMEMEIHKSFPQAYDIALYFSLLIEKEFQLIVSNNEISYLALYFNYGIDSYLVSSKGKKVLIITSLRKSETTLLRHEILNRFSKRIESIDFIAPSKADINKISEYDAAFTTERSLAKFKSSISFINLFPTEKDLNKIELAINGYNKIDDVLNKFSPSCFFCGEVKSKKQILNIITKNATQTYHLSEDLLFSINEREKLSSTYFGNEIAIPHPLTPISEETFVSLALLQNSISWDEKNNVKIVMLVSIGKDSPKELQFWYYLSSFIDDSKFAKKLLAKPTFDNFLETLKLSLNDKFK